jgi:hypothetical protein
VSSDVDASSVGGRICPNCRELLREIPRREQVATVAAPETPASTISVTYCGSCGWDLAVTPPPAFRRIIGMRASPIVAGPPDTSTPCGQFQLRCRLWRVGAPVAGTHVGLR